jgi:hypothetical protein
MNANQWLAIISAAAPSFKWTIIKGDIRTTDGRCPICAALYWVSDGQINYGEYVHKALIEADLDFGSETYQIVCSADDRKGHFPSGLRNALLAAVGFPIS